ncbi:pectin lyase fold/virulence factor [Thelonectria olida]|uniref:pectin lyase n=1 Tax=Thelonectria olida TaxID=1576542 RepID=A0A9P8W077_9HYPO|nr:pectin lyase fold/virulence factor [Thelonectria olida]
MKLVLLSVLAAAASCVHAQVTGTSKGFAAGTTGGGSATPQYPSSLDELTKWLTDSTARVIMINKTWDFRSAGGTTTGKCCRDTATTVCSGGTSKGQAWIQDTCTSGTAISCTYYNSPRTPIDVGSNKSIVGVGSKGVIVGKGLRIRGGASNVIIQNIHITNLNPEYVWGGDAITLDGADKVWIDHCKFSLIGRQMLVSGWGAAGHVTISNNEFDGVTSWSAGCNGKHYWTMLFLGLKDYYTFVGNWVHDVSGRAPHMGTDKTNSQIYFHAVNNYFQNIGGHAFDIGTNTFVLIEGNKFDNVDTPLTSGSKTSGAQIYEVVSVADASGCTSKLGYICEWNKLTGSGSFPSLTSSTALSKLSTYKSSLVSHTSVDNVAKSVTANAGIGKL